MGSEVAIFPDERQVGRLRKIEWDPTNRHPIYIGTAPVGTLTSEAKWFIRKVTYNAAGNPIDVQPHFNVVWDNRSSL